MVQPYFESVDAHGETATVFFGGVYSHAIRKGGMLEHDQALETDLFRPEDIRARRASPAEIEAAQRVLDVIPFDPARLTYARIDLIRNEEGVPAVLELELVEPSIFLGYAEGAADRIARAVGGHPALA